MRITLRVLLTLVLLASALPGTASGTLNAQTFPGTRALEYARKLVALGPRWVGSTGHRKAENFIKKTFAKDALEDDSFQGLTPEGLFPMHNFIVRFPGKKNGVIVLASHYETNYPLRNTSYVGANDGAATSGLLMAIADQLRGKRLAGYSVWLVFFDGEEAFDSWSQSDSTYGSRHLAVKWQNDGTLRRIKGFLLADMIGDRVLNVDRDSNSTPWVLDLVKQAAKNTKHEANFFKRTNMIEDDHLPFVVRGVPCADVIDIDYGPHDAKHPDGYHHTVEDTMDKISARSLAISGDVFVESIRLLNQR